MHYSTVHYSTGYITVHYSVLQCVTVCYSMCGSNVPPAMANCLSRTPWLIVLTRALGQVTGVQNRSVEILLTSSNKVKMNCNDIVQMNDNDNEHIDILDFPLYERQSDLLNHQSQF